MSDSPREAMEPNLHAAMETLFLKRQEQRSSAGLEELGIAASKVPRTYQDFLPPPPNNVKGLPIRIETVDHVGLVSSAANGNAIAELALAQLKARSVQRKLNEEERGFLEEALALAVKTMK